MCKSVHNGGVSVILNTEITDNFIMRLLSTSFSVDTSQSLLPVLFLNGVMDGPKRKEHGQCSAFVYDVVRRVTNYIFFREG